MYWWIFGGNVELILNPWFHTSLNAWSLFRIWFPWSSIFEYFTHKILHVFVSLCEYRYTESFWKICLTRTKSASFYATGGVCGVLKYGLVVLSTFSALGTKGLQYYILGKEVMDVSYFLFCCLFVRPYPT